MEKKVNKDTKKPTKSFPFVKVIEQEKGIEVTANGTVTDLMYLTAILIKRISELAGIPAPAIAKIVGNSLEKAEKDADDIISLSKVLLGGRK